MKKQEIITRLRKFMEDANGEGSWKEFVGSQLEGDVANFVMSEIHPMYQFNAFKEGFQAATGSLNAANKSIQNRKFKIK